MVARKIPDPYKSVGNDYQSLHAENTDNVGDNKELTIDINDSKKVYKNRKPSSLKKDATFDISNYMPFTRIYPKLTRGVIDTDDRVVSPIKKEPYKAICLLLIKDFKGNLYRGTGFLISERCVITAGHCVFRNGSWVKEVEVIPGTFNGNKPYGSFVSKWFKSVEGWVTYGKSKYDHGAIMLNDDTLFSQVKFCLRYKQYSGENPVEVSGYPYDKNGQQWKSSGTAKCNENYIFYEIDTLIGDSGSPVFIRTGDSFDVVGVHTKGRTDSNSATRVNQEIVDCWNLWSNTKE